MPAAYGLSSTGLLLFFFFFFFFNDTATTEIYTLSLHDALPILIKKSRLNNKSCREPGYCCRSEEHTSELQSLRHLVCRLLLEKKKKKNKIERNIIVERRTEGKVRVPQTV